MRGRLSDRRWRPLTFIGIALYAVFLVVAPFAHHDLMCHLKNPLHCTACTSSLPGSDPQTPVTIGASSLADAGRAVAIHVLADDTLLSVRSTGRSPPA
jgi:hypothetical protein